MKKLKKLWLLAALVLSLAAPSSLPLIGTAETVSAAADVNKTVGISNKKVTLIKGQKKQLKVTGTTKSVQWISSKKAVATVSNKGLVTAKSKGTAVITAKVGKSKFTCTVTVQTPSLNYKSKTINTGTKFRLSVRGTNSKVTWKSSDSRIASVSLSGVVTGKRAGTCTIYATFLGKKLKCKVTVKKPVPQIQYVWLSATGSKYHSIPNCGNMNPSRARQVTLSEALSLGRSACSKCY